MIRHLVVPDHVCHPHLGRVTPELASDEVHRTLHGEGRFRASGAAIGGVRDLVGGDDPGAHGEIFDFIGSGKSLRCCRRCPIQSGSGAAIAVAVAERQQAALVVEPAQS
jgi:hypothetical protein